MSPIPSNRYAEAIFAIGIVKKLQGKNARGVAPTPPGRPRVNIFSLSKVAYVRSVMKPAISSYAVIEAIA